MSVGRKGGNGRNKTAPSSGGQAGASPLAVRGIVERLVSSRSWQEGCRVQVAVRFSLHGQW